MYLKSIYLSKNQYKKDIFMHIQHIKIDFVYTFKILSWWIINIPLNKKGLEKMNTGERIKSLRTEKGLTQEELGDMLGVKKAAIQKYENGAIINLKVDTIKRLSDIFNVSPNYIIGWIDEDTNSISYQSKFFNYIVHENFGNDVAESIEKLYFMSDTGKKKVKEYIYDIYKIDEYLNKDKMENFKKDIEPLLNNQE